MLQSYLYYTSVAEPYNGLSALLLYYYEIMLLLPPYYYYYYFFDIIITSSLLLLPYYYLLSLPLYYCNYLSSLLHIIITLLLWNYYLYFYFLIIKLLFILLRNYYLEDWTPPPWQRSRVHWWVSSPVTGEEGRQDSLFTYPSRRYYPTRTANRKQRWRLAKKVSMRGTGESQGGGEAWGAAK